MAKVSLEEAFSFIEGEAAKAGVDPETAKSILLAENFSDKEIPSVMKQPKGIMVDSDKVSPKQARGLMQVMPATLEGLKGQGFLPSEFSMDSWQNQITAGVASLKEIQKRQGTDDPRIIAADYNSGPRGANSYKTGGNIPAETQNYLVKLDMAKTGFAPRPSSRDVRMMDNVSAAPADSSQSLETSTKRTVTEKLGGEALIDILNQSNKWIADQISVISSSSDSEAAHQRAAAVSLERAGQEAGFSATLKASVEGAAIQARERALQILNLDTRDPTNILASKLADYTVMEGKRKVLENEIDQRMGVGLFDNPIEYLVNQTILPGQVAQHNALARRQNDAMSFISTAQTIAGKQESIDIGATADQVARLGVHLANAQVAEGNAKAETARAAAESATARKALTIAGLVDRQFDNATKVAHWQTILEQDVEKRKDKTKAAEDDAELDKRIQRLGQTIGAPQMNLATLRRESQGTKDDWMKRVGKNSVGDNFYEAVTFVSKYGNLQNMAKGGSAELARMFVEYNKMITDAANQESALIQNSGGKIPPRSELLESAANKLEHRFFAQRNNMLIADPYNPYVIPHAQMAMGGWKGDPENAAYKLVNEAQKTKMRMNDDILFSAVSKLVDNEVIPPKVAAQQLSDYYLAAVKRNNAARSFPVIGMELQEDYKILPKQTRLTINLLNPTEVENVFTRRAAANRAAKLDPMGFGMGGDVITGVGVER